jgi:hypothetical protein
VSRRIFVNVRRGPMDNTAICVYPWELPCLELVHMNSVEEVSIDQMATTKDGRVKVEKLKLKHTEVPAPDLRSQLEAMVYVDPEDDPANDAAGEYERLAGKYGMDKDFPMAVVERIYGAFSSGAFEAKLKEFGKDHAEKPTFLRATEEGLAKHPKDMKVGELRKALTERGVKWNPRQGQPVLAQMLEDALAPA